MKLMTQIPDCVALEMRMAELMSQQETSGFRFDMDAAERVREELSREAQNITEKIAAIYQYYPGKVFTPKRTSAKTGYVAGAPMTKLVDFNPTSRQHIAWALHTFRGARFTKVTDSGKPKVDEACLSEVADIALSQDNQQLHDECNLFIRLLTLQKWMGQLSEGTNSWFNSIEPDGSIHHSCSLGYSNWAQCSPWSQPWASCKCSLGT
jgi:DNA polymerase-1